MSYYIIELSYCFHHRLDLTSNSHSTTRSNAKRRNLSPPPRGSRNYPSSKTLKTSNPKRSVKIWVPSPCATLSLLEIIPWRSPPRRITRKRRASSLDSGPPQNCPTFLRPWRRVSLRRHIQSRAITLDALPRASWLGRTNWAILKEGVICLLSLRWEDVIGSPPWQLCIRLLPCLWGDVSIFF